MLQVLHGKEASHFNVILDNSSSNQITYGILKHLTNRKDGIHLICCRDSPEIYQDVLEDDKRIVFHDLFTDPMNWDSKGSSLTDIVNRLEISIVHQHIVVIDDLVLFRRSFCKSVTEDVSWRKLFDVLKQLYEVQPVFVFVNSNLVKEAYLRQLKHLSTFYAYMNYALQQHQCETVLRKRSGKIVTETLTLHFNKMNELIIHKKKLPQKNGNADTEKEDPASNLTFNLRLTDSEKKARDNVILPYILTADDKSSYLSKSSGQASVSYTPDDLDDFDEEDPDDDLDI